MRVANSGNGLFSLNSTVLASTALTEAMKGMNWASRAVFAGSSTRVKL